MEVNKKNTEMIERCESVYLVVRYAHWCVREYKWTGKWNRHTNTPRLNPIVYYYNDHNGEYEEYQLIDIFHTTTGEIFMWTFDEYVADKVAEMLEERDNAKVNRQRYI